MILTKSERFLFDWLTEEDFSQYGECYGKDLDSLIAKGLVQIHGPGEHQSGFIAKGQGLMFSAVSLTEAGVQLAIQHRKEKMDQIPEEKE